MLYYEALRMFENDVRNTKVVSETRLGCYKSCMIAGVDEQVRSWFTEISYDRKSNIGRTGWKLALRHAEIDARHCSVSMHVDRVLQVRGRNETDTDPHATPVYIPPCLA